MTVEQMIEKARQIRRSATFNRKTRIIRVYGKSVDHIPCYRCGGTGRITLGADAFAGMARCGVCQGRKVLNAQDIERNILWNQQQRELATSDTKVFEEFDKLAKEAAKKSPNSANSPQSQPATA